MAAASRTWHLGFQPVQRMPTLYCESFAEQCYSGLTSDLRKLLAPHSAKRGRLPPHVQGRSMESGDVI